MAAFEFLKNDVSCQEKSEMTNRPNHTDKKEGYSERSAFYKKPIKKDNIKLELEFNDTPQEIRRQRILHYQKVNRDKTVNERRGLLGDVLHNDLEDEMEAEEEFQGMEVDRVKRKFYKTDKRYINLFMLSEWMLEVPQDFTEKWIMVPYPVGRRSLLIAHKGITMVYTKKGVLIKKFKSALPGGNLRQNKMNCTIIDCVWDEDKEIFYVLDVLAWSKQEMLNCDTECRQYWVKSKVEETDELRIRKKGINDYPFELLPSVPCDGDIYGLLERMAPTIKLDGLLFYHKEVHYTHGKTPLVVWLKPYMLPEILGINVPAPYDEKPSSYINFEHHVLKVIQQEKEAMEKEQKKKGKTIPEFEAME